MLSKKIKLIILAILITWGTREAVLKWANPNAPQEGWVSSQHSTMYSTAKFTLKADSALAQKTTQELLDFFNGLTYEFQDNSPLFTQISNAKPGDTLQLTAVANALFKDASEIEKTTQGRITPSIGALLDLWGLRRGKTPQVPDSSDIAKVKESLKQKHFSLVEPNSIVIHKTTRPIFGAFTEGFALDFAKQVLQNNKIENYLIEIGGDFIWKGANPKGEAWSIALTDPQSKSDFLGVLKLNDFNGQGGALSTSGSYQQFFTDSATGKTYHHILDPNTAYPSESVFGSTVICPSSLVADYSSTELMILGDSKFDKWSGRKDTQKCKVILTDSKGKLFTYGEPKLTLRNIQRKVSKL